jgi:hypothetical protein
MSASVHSPAKPGSGVLKPTGNTDYVSKAWLVEVIGLGDASPLGKHKAINQACPHHRVAVS